MSTGNNAMQPPDFCGLTQLFDGLAAFGFKITYRQRASVVQLCAALLQNRSFPPRERFCNMLASILCTNGDEQCQFRPIFDACFPRINPAELIGALGRTCDGPLKPDERNHRPERPVRSEKPVRGVWETVRLTIVTAAFLSFLFAVLLLALKLPLPSAVEITPPQPPPQRPIKPAHGGTKPLGTATPPPQMEPPPPSPSPSPSPSPVPEPARNGRPETRRETGFTAGWLEQLNDIGPLPVLLLMLPLILIAATSGTLRGLHFLRSRRSVIVPRPRMVEILMNAPSRIGLVDPAFYRSLQPMRRRVAVPSSEIDVPRSVEATARNAGLPTIVTSPKMVSPEYLVLIDRPHRRDVQGRIAEAFVQVLEQAGIHVVRYYFDQDPRRLYVQSGARALDLDDFSPQRFPRLLMLSAGAGLMDITTGRLEPWARDFARWPTAVLLTPTPQSQWTAFEEALLPECGLTVLPLSEEGFVRAARFFANEKSPSNPARKESPQVTAEDSLAVEFEVGAMRWIAGSAPTRIEVRRLMSRLRAQLSPCSFQWLQALAVYPGMYWSVVQHLGNAVRRSEDQLSSEKPASEQAKHLGKEARQSDISSTHMDALVKLASLPWLREGHMPPWLRIELIAGIADPEFAPVRRVLAELVAVKPARSSDSRSLAGHSIQSSDLRVLARDLERGSLEDGLLLDFMTRTVAPGLDPDYRAKMAQLVGLQSKESLWGQFLGRGERAALLEQAEELAAAVQSRHSPRFVVRRQPSNHLSLWCYEVLEVSPDRSSAQTLNKPLFLCRTGPNDAGGRVVSEQALAALKARKQQFWRFAPATTLLFLALLALVYRPFLESRSTLGIEVTWLAVILLSPFPVFTLLLIRPYERLLRQFPKVPEAVVSSRGDY